jgi:peptidyl-prolyl cis-trans isomerase A (cyclophilin A)
MIPLELFLCVSIPARPRLVPLDPQPDVPYKRESRNIHLRRKPMLKRIALTLALSLTLCGTALAAGNPIVLMDTSLGKIKIELYAKEAPVSVKNFLEYVHSGFYNDTIFHRVINGFMIQGGGFTAEMKQKPTRAAIKNEAANGLKNDRGAIAMARTGFPDSATSQFFINVVNNDGLNRPKPDGFGYAVFGKVISGMDVVDKIKSVRTGYKMGMGDVPDTPVVIKSVTVVK